eukprot:6923214-Prymnesium_polylepis.1
MGKGGGIPYLEVKQQRPKAELCLKYFNGMVTDEEKRVLKPLPPATDGEPARVPDDGRRRSISTNLNMLVVDRLAQAYEEASLEVPRDFSKEGYMLPATGIATHCDASSKLKGKGLVPDPSTFAAWRKEQEAQEASGEGSSSRVAAKAPPRKKPRK